MYSAARVSAWPAASTLKPDLSQMPRMDLLFYTGQSEAEHCRHQTGALSYLAYTHGRKLSADGFGPT